VKAIVLYTYGGPEMLELRDIEDPPVPKPKERAGSLAARMFRALGSAHARSGMSDTRLLADVGIPPRMRPKVCLGRLPE
jgi:hypothetical protein